MRVNAALSHSWPAVAPVVWRTCSANSSRSVMMYKIRSAYNTFFQLFFVILFYQNVNNVVPSCEEKESACQTISEMLLSIFSLGWHNLVLWCPCFYVW